MFWSPTRRKLTAASHVAVFDARLLFLAYAGKVQQGSGPGSGRHMNTAQVWLLASGLPSIASGTATSVVSLLIISLHCFWTSLNLFGAGPQMRSACPTAWPDVKKHKREDIWADSPLTGSFSLLHALCLWRTTLQIASLKKNPATSALWLPQCVLPWFLSTVFPRPWHYLAGPCLSSMYQETIWQTPLGLLVAGGKWKDGLS